MTHLDTIRTRIRTSLLLILPALLVALAACDSSPTEGDNGNDHPESERVELHTRGVPSMLLAVWEDGDGWRDADGNAITELPNSVQPEGEDLQPLRARGANASLTVRYFFADGTEVDMGTISRDDDTRERVCTEYSARYYATDDQTNVIAWPNIRHPDSPQGSLQFARRANDELVGIFHCDHIHFYPEHEGEVEVELHLWHLDHSDGHTDPITIRVEEGIEPARFEIETRGVPRTTLAVWNAVDGWTDNDGNAISSLESVRQVEGEGIIPLTAFGSNASLSLRYFAAGGEEVEFGTVSRDDDTRERVCTSQEGRFLVEGESTDVLPWPNIAHPDSPGGETQFAELADGSLVGIFHCDHIHFYPEEAGEVEVRMVMWEDGGVGAMSEPITLVVNEN